MTAKLERPARQCLEDRRSAPCNSLVFFVLSQLLFCVWHFKWPMPIPHNYYIYSLYFDTLGFRGISLWSVSKWLEWSKKGAVEGGAKIKALSAALSSRVTRPSHCSNPDFLITSSPPNQVTLPCTMINLMSYSGLRTLSWLLFSISTRSMARVLFDQTCSGHVGEAEQSRSPDHPLTK